MRLDRQEALTGKSLLLLDFDGPVCSVFAGYPASIIAAELVEHVRTFSPNLGDSLTGETNPMKVLRSAAANLPRKTVNRIDEFLCRAELRAIDSAEPTEGAAELIDGTLRAGKTVGIVSNNCPRAIARYLEREGLDSKVSVVVGRPFGRPRRMKPDPYLILEALGFAGIDASRACFIGDSVTDMEAGKAVGVTTIGYANAPGKDEPLREAGATVVVTAL